MSFIREGSEKHLLAVYVADLFKSYSFSLSLKYLSCICVNGSQSTDERHKLPKEKDHTGHFVKPSEEAPGI